MSVVVTDRYYIFHAVADCVYYVYEHASGHWVAMFDYGARFSDYDQAGALAAADAWIAASV